MASTPNQAGGPPPPSGGGASRDDKLAKGRDMLEAFKQRRAAGTPSPFQLQRQQQQQQQQQAAAAVAAAPPVAGDGDHSSPSGSGHAGPTGAAHDDVASRQLQFQTPVPLRGSRVSDTPQAGAPGTTQGGVSKPGMGGDLPPLPPANKQLFAAPPTAQQEAGAAAERSDSPEDTPDVPSALQPPPVPSNTQQDALSAQQRQQQAAEIEQWKARYEALEGEVKGWKNAAEETQRRLEATNQQWVHQMAVLEAAAKDKDSTHATRIQQLQNESELLKEELAGQKAKVESSQQMLELERRQHAEEKQRSPPPGLVTSPAEVDAWKRQLQESQEQVHSMSAQKQHLQQTFDHHTTQWQHEKEELLRRQKELEGMVEGLKMNNSEFERRHQEALVQLQQHQLSLMTVEQQQKDNKDRKIVELEQELAVARGLVEQLRKAKDEEQSQLQHLQNDEVAALQKEVERMRHDAEVKENQLMQANQLVLVEWDRDKAQQAELMRETTARYEKERHTLEQQLGEAQRSIATAQQDYQVKENNLMSEAAKLRSELDHMKQVTQHAAELQSQHEHATQLLQQQLQDAQQRVNDATKRAETSDATIKALRKDVEEITARMQEAEQQHIAAMDAARKDLEQQKQLLGAVEDQKRQQQIWEQRETEMKQAHQDAIRLLQEKATEERNQHLQQVAVLSKEVEAARQQERDAQYDWEQRWEEVQAHKDAMERAFEIQKQSWQEELAAASAVIAEDVTKHADQVSELQRQYDEEAAQAEKERMRLVQQVEQLTSQHEQALQDMRLQHETDRQALQASHKQELERIQSTGSDDMQSVRSHAAQLQEHAASLERRLLEATQKLSEAEKSYHESERQHKEKSAQAAEEKALLLQQVEQMSSQHQQALQDVRSHHEAELHALTESHKKDVAAIQNSSSEDLRGVRKHAAELRDQIESLERRISDAVHHQSVQQEAHQVELQRAKEEHEATLAALKEQHQQELKDAEASLRKELMEKWMDEKKFLEASIRSEEQAKAFKERLAALQEAEKEHQSDVAALHDSHLKLRSEVEAKLREQLAEASEKDKKAHEASVRAEEQAKATEARQFLEDHYAKALEKQKATLEASFQDASQRKEQELQQHHKEQVDALSSRLQEMEQQLEVTKKETVAALEAAKRQWEQDAEASLEQLRTELQRVQKELSHWSSMVDRLGRAVLLGGEQMLWEHYEVEANTVLELSSRAIGTRNASTKEAAAAGASVKKTPKTRRVVPSMYDDDDAAEEDEDSVIEGLSPVAEPQLDHPEGAATAATPIRGGGPTAATVLIPPPQTPLRLQALMAALDENDALHDELEAMRNQYEEQSVRAAEEYQKLESECHQHQVDVTEMSCLLEQRTKALKELERIVTEHSQRGRTEETTLREQKDEMLAMLAAMSQKDERLDALQSELSWVQSQRNDLEDERDRTIQENIQLEERCQALEQQCRLKQEEDEESEQRKQDLLKEHQQLTLKVEFLSFQSASYFSELSALQQQRENAYEEQQLLLQTVVEVEEMVREEWAQWREWTLGYVRWVWQGAHGSAGLNQQDPTSSSSGSLEVQHRLDALFGTTHFYFDAGANVSDTPLGTSTTDVSGRSPTPSRMLAVSTPSSLVVAMPSPGFVFRSRGINGLCTQQYDHQDTVKSVSQRYQQAEDSLKIMRRAFEMEQQNLAETTEEKYALERRCLELQELDQRRRLCLVGSSIGCGSGGGSQLPIDAGFASPGPFVASSIANTTVPTTATTSSLLVGGGLEGLFESSVILLWRWYLASGSQQLELQNTVTEQQEVMAQLRDAMKKLQQELKEYQSKEEEQRYDLERREESEEQDRRQRLRKEQQLQEQVTTLKEQKEAWLEKGKSLEEEVSKLSQRVRDLEHQEKEWKDHLEHVKGQLEQQNLHGEKQDQQWKAQKQNWVQQQKELEKELEELHSERFHWEQEGQSLKQSLSVKDRDLGQQKEVIDSLRKKYDDLLQQMHALEEQHHALKRQCEDVERDQEKWKQKSEHQSKELEKLQEDCLTAVQRNHELEHEHRSWKPKLVAFEKQSVQWEEEKDQWIMTLTNANEERDEWKKKALTREQEFKRLGLDHASLTKRNTDVEQSLETLQHELERSMNQKNQQIKELQQQLLESQEGADTAKWKSDQAEQELEKIKKEYAQVKQDKDLQEREYCMLNTQWKTEMSSLTSERNALQKQQQMLQKKLSDWIEKEDFWKQQGQRLEERKEQLVRELDQQKKEQQAQEAKASAVQKRLEEEKKEMMGEVERLMKVVDQQKHQQEMQMGSHQKDQQKARKAALEEAQVTLNAMERALEIEKHHAYEARQARDSLQKFVDVLREEKSKLLARVVSLENQRPSSEKRVTDLMSFAESVANMVGMGNMRAPSVANSNTTNNNNNNTSQDAASSLPLKDILSTVRSLVAAGNSSNGYGNGLVGSAVRPNQPPSRGVSVLTGLAGERTPSNSIPAGETLLSQQRHGFNSNNHTNAATPRGQSVTGSVMNAPQAPTPQQQQQAQHAKRIAEDDQAMVQDLTTLLQQHHDLAATVGEWCHRNHAVLANAVEDLRKRRPPTTSSTSGPMSMSVAEAQAAYRNHKAALSNWEQQNLAVHRCVRSAEGFQASVAGQRDNIQSFTRRVNQTLVQEATWFGVNHAMETVRVARTAGQTVLATIVPRVQQQIEQLKLLAKGSAAWHDALAEAVDRDPERHEFSAGSRALSSTAEISTAGSRPASRLPPPSPAPGPNHIYKPLLRTVPHDAPTPNFQVLTFSHAVAQAMLGIPLVADLATAMAVFSFGDEFVKASLTAHLPPVPLAASPPVNFHNTSGAAPAPHDLSGYRPPTPTGSEPAPEQSYQTVRRPGGVVRSPMVTPIHPQALEAEHRQHQHHHHVHDSVVTPHYDPQPWGQPGSRSQSSSQFQQPTPSQGPPRYPTDAAGGYRGGSQDMFHPMAAVPAPDRNRLSPPPTPERGTHHRQRNPTAQPPARHGADQRGSHQPRRQPERHHGVESDGTMSEGSLPPSDYDSDESLTSYSSGSSDDHGAPPTRGHRSSTRPSGNAANTHRRRHPGESIDSEDQVMVYNDDGVASNVPGSVDGGQSDRHTVKLQRENQRLYRMLRALNEKMKGANKRLGGNDNDVAPDRRTTGGRLDRPRSGGDKSRRRDDTSQMGRSTPNEMDRSGNAGPGTGGPPSTVTFLPGIGVSPVSQKPRPSSAAVVRPTSLPEALTNRGDYVEEDRSNAGGVETPIGLPPPMTTVPPSRSRPTSARRIPSSGNMRGPSNDNVDRRRGASGDSPVRIGRSDTDGGRGVYLESPPPHGSRFEDGDAEPPAFLAAGGDSTPPPPPTDSEASPATLERRTESTSPNDADVVPAGGSDGNDNNTNNTYAAMPSASPYSKGKKAGGKNGRRR